MKLPTGVMMVELDWKSVCKTRSGIFHFSLFERKERNEEKDIQIQTSLYIL